MSLGEPLFDYCVFRETFGEAVAGQGRHRGFNNWGYVRSNGYYPRRGGDGNPSHPQNSHRYNQRNDYNRSGYNNAVVFSRENANYQNNHRGHNQWGGMRREQTSGPWVGVY